MPAPRGTTPCPASWPAPARPSERAARWKATAARCGRKARTELGFELGRGDGLPEARRSELGRSESAMKTLIGACLAVLIAGGAAMAQPAPNTLTAAEKAAGWKLLFDGRTTAGWRGFKAEAPDPGWQARDGALSPDP